MLIPENKRRIFVAVDVPLETEMLIEILKQQIPVQPSFKWMRIQNLHLTLYFIGNIQQEHYDCVVKECRELVSRFDPFTLKFDSLVTMPSYKPNMIWARYKEHAVFTRLYHLLHDRLKLFTNSNFELYEHPIPHITIARFHGLKQAGFIKLPSHYSLPDINIEKAFVWETQTADGQSNYIRDAQLILKGQEDRIL